MTDTIRFTVFGRPQQRGSKTFASCRGGGALLVAKGGAPELEPFGKAFVVRNAYPIITDENNASSKRWMKAVASAASLVYPSGQLITRPVVLTARFYFRRPKIHFGTGRNAERLKDSAPEHHGQSPDLAKLLRALEDALTNVLWEDDRLVCGYGGETGRYWVGEPGEQERAEVTVEVLG